MQDKALTIDVGTGSTRAAILLIFCKRIRFRLNLVEQRRLCSGLSEHSMSVLKMDDRDCIREVLYRYPETAARVAVAGDCRQIQTDVLLDD
ncbi:hypothetical protein [Klebsiella pneumoniae]|uniref:hypothetical protein n=1 Tax=Klebsiella pneumoniae TaxID=573 RepID=UPI0011E4E0A3|nr:hypothetical protein [Klebsiella pneumoniae]